MDPDLVFLYLVLSLILVAVSAENEYPLYLPENGLYCAKCNAGQFIVKDCTERFGDPVCEDCPDNTYVEGLSQVRQCSPCTKCSEIDAIIERNCSKTQNTKCVCPEGQYMANKYLGCLPCYYPKVVFKGEDFDTCGPCPNGHFVNGTKCSVCTPCSKGEFVIEECTAVRDTKCALPHTTVITLHNITSTQQTTTTSGCGVACVVLAILFVIAMIFLIILTVVLVVKNRRKGLLPFFGYCEYHKPNMENNEEECEDTVQYTPEKEETVADSTNWLQVTTRILKDNIGDLHTFVLHLPDFRKFKNEVRWDQIKGGDEANKFMRFMTQWANAGGQFTDILEALEDMSLQKVIEKLYDEEKLKNIIPPQSDHRASVRNEDHRASVRNENHRASVHNEDHRASVHNEDHRASVHNEDHRASVRNQNEVPQVTTARLHNNGSENSN